MLKAMDISGVKVDVQSAIPQLGQRRGGGFALAKLFQRALRDSVEEHFAQVSVTRLNLYLEQQFEDL
jgi:hypothetical protein